MNVLITGGHGNLGLWLTKYFLNNGCQVYVLGRNKKNGIEHENYHFLCADVTHYDSLVESIDCYFDACIHTASFNEHFKDNYSKEALLINSLGTEYLCRALLKYGVGKLIYLSTFHVYGENEGLVTENTPIAPLNDYGLTHYFAEKYIEKNSKVHNLKYVIFRLSNSYGCPTDKNTDKWYLIFNDFCNQAFNFKKITINGNPNSMRDFIWMGDVVEAIYEAVKIDDLVNNCFNLSTSKSTSLYDLAMVVADSYFDLYGEPIAIECKSELEKVGKLTVCNKKLKKAIPKPFKNKFSIEAKAIFDLLNKV